MTLTPINSGWIEVICGSMFSGKTEELMRRLRRAEIAKMNIEIFKPKIDSRFSSEHIVSHDRSKRESHIIDDPKEILKFSKIPIQGGLDPKILLSDKQILKSEALKYLDIFKDHPYIFNLGHGILPETSPEMVKLLVQTVKEYK